MKTQLSRRLLLRSSAVTLALPFLPSAVWSRRAGAATCAPPRRFVGWFVPNGFNMPDWTPTTVGTSFDLTPIAKPLDPIRKKILILTGLDHQAIAVPGTPPGDHGAGVGCFLNMISVFGHLNDPARTSLDQALLPALIPDGCTQPLLKSLQLGIQGDNGLCDRAACIFSRTITWNQGVPLPNIWDPQICFDRMFAGPAPVAAATGATQRLMSGTSILDPLQPQAQALKGKLNPADRRTFDAHTTAVREVEVRLRQATLGLPMSASSSNAATSTYAASIPPQALAAGAACPRPARPDMSPPLNFDRGITPSDIVQTHTALFVDLMAIAFQCDITRAINFMQGNGNSNNDFAFLIGSSAPHHAVSNHDGNPAKLAELTTIDTWEVDQASQFLQRLDSMIESDGQSVLDHTTFFLSSDVADGATNNHWDLPVLLAGGASGALKIDGRHINYTPTLTFPRPLVGPRSDTQTGRVFISILQAHGMMRDTFGMATGGPLPELMI